MKNLTQILEGIEILGTKGLFDEDISCISINSNQMQIGGIFVAIDGAKLDGHSFINDAIKSGAKVIVHDKDLSDYTDGVTYVKVADTKQVVGILAHNFFGKPSQKLKLVGVTGTNGKTTIATLSHELFRKLGYKVGMIGTVVNKINDEVFEASLTTPDAVTLNQLLYKMCTAGCEYVFMEVSSQAVELGRVNGLQFAGGIFTNLTQDHLDFHHTMAEYRDAKKKFFDMLPAGAFALSNIDDANGEYMLINTKANKHFYSLQKDIEFNDRLQTKLIGEFNVYNALAVYGTAILLGEDKEKVKEIIKTLDPAPGRFESMKSESGVTGVVDFAHTPDAVENVLRTIGQMKNGGKLITVIGCGGDRDKSKRPIMARLAHDMSDITILTADNPRSENVADILADMRVGIPENSQEPFLREKVLIISDRHEAIARACKLAGTGDYVAILGKGHENYQEVNGIKTHFSDMEELKKNLI